jgi:hypothetical protein
MCVCVCVYIYIYIHIYVYLHSCICIYLTLHATWFVHIRALTWIISNQGRYGLNTCAVTCEILRILFTKIITMSEDGQNMMKT